MIFKEIIKYETKNYFPNYWALIGLLFGVIINLMAYYFTSKALSPNINISDPILHQGYFEYIILGEILLLVPQLAISDSVEIYFRYRDSGILEKMFLLKNGPLLTLFHVFISQVFIKLLYVFITFILVFILYKTHFSLIHLFNLIIAMLFSALVFLPFFFLIIFISMLRKKRISAIHYLMTIFSLASGAYFPIEVIGNNSLIHFFKVSPMNLIISTGRDFIYGKINFLELISFQHLWIWGIVVVAFNYLFYKYFINYFKVNILK